MAETREGRGGSSEAKAIPSGPELRYKCIFEKKSNRIKMGFTTFIPTVCDLMYHLLYKWFLFSFKHYLISHYWCHQKVHFIQNFNGNIKSAVLTAYHTRWMRWVESMMIPYWKQIFCGANMISCKPHQNSEKDGYWFQSLGDRHRKADSPWTKAKDKWQKQQLFWECESCSCSLGDQQNKDLKMSSQR